MKLGIQLYSVRKWMAENPIDTLNKVVGVGYKHIEAANHNAAEDFGLGFGVTVEETKAILEDSNSSILGAHILPVSLESIPKIAAFYQAIMAKYITVAIDFFEDADEVKRKSEIYNEAGKICSEYGLQFIYHNHFHEFQIMDGKTVLDWILEYTDPKFVGVELDTYWCMRSGNDPVETMEKLGHRVKLVHQKDMPKGFENEVNMLEVAVEKHLPITMDNFLPMIKEKSFTEIGEGIMDIQKIIDTAKKFTASEFLILEQDYSELDEIDSIRVSYNNLARYSGIEI